MKLNEFKKKMKKGVFPLEEAKRIAWETAPATFRLQLHQWTRSGELIRLKRGIYGFPELINDKIAVAKVLYSPAYISLEYALNAYGLLPDAIFAMTLVTPKTTRNFKTPAGQFIYQSIKPELFWGYNPQTLMGECEKVIVDYCYLNSARLHPDPLFWETARWQNLGEVNFKKCLAIAEKFSSKKVLRLVRSLKQYGDQHGRPETSH